MALILKGVRLSTCALQAPRPSTPFAPGWRSRGLAIARLFRSAIITTPNGNEVLINLEEKGEGAEALDAGKTAILNALHATLGAGEAGKQDFNAAGADTIAEVLTRKDPLALGTAAGDRYNQLAPPAGSRFATVTAAAS